MPTNKKYLARFEFDNIYHIYNRTNNKELMFRDAENYQYFLTLFEKYINPIAETFAWNLLPNHFHLIIRIRSEQDIIERLNAIPKKLHTLSERKFIKNKNIDRLTSMQFKRLFTSYAMSYNLRFLRRGNLFYRTFKRVVISKEQQFTSAVFYVHANAAKHGLVKKFDDYPWTSYHILLQDQLTNILRNEILDWFGGRENLIKIHRELALISF